MQEDVFLLPVKCDYILIGIGEESLPLIRKVHQNLTRPFENILNNYYLNRHTFFRQILFLTSIPFQNFEKLKVFHYFQQNHGLVLKPGTLF